MLKKMKANPKSSRKNVRLKNFDYSSAGYYFVTVVSHQRKNIFGEIDNGKMILSQAGVIVEEIWEAIPNHFSHTNIDSYVVMPNHIHGIIFLSEVGARRAAPGSTKNHTLGVVVGSFKSTVTKRVHEEGMFVNERVWQRNYYEHVIRDEPDYYRILDYIENNPANWLRDEENVVLH